MPEVKLPATARTEFGKGAARRIRRAHQIPAVLYGHGEAPVHIALPGHDTMLALKHSNVLLAIELDGGRQLAVVKDVQRDPVKNVIEHVDLLAVRSGEKITVEVPVVVTGESAQGTLHVVETQSLTVEAEATHLPESVEVSIEGLEEGAQIRAGDVTLPSGTTLVTDAEELVIAVSVPRVSAEDAGEVTEASAEESAAVAEADGETAEESEAEGSEAEEA